MTEYEVNQLLSQGLKAAEYQRKLGHVDLYKEILGLTSKYCASLIKIYKLNGKVECNQCRSQFNRDIERDFIREFGMCLGCDKLYGEIIEERVEEEYENLN